MPPWTQAPQPASGLEGGLRLPQLGDERDALIYLEQQYFPAYFTLACAAEEVVPLRLLERLRDESYQHMILGDFAAVGRLTRATAEHASTPRLRQGERMMAFELLLRLRWRRARPAAAQGRPPGRLSAIDLLEHQLVACLVRPLPGLPAAAGSRTPGDER